MREREREERTRGGGQREDREGERTEDSLDRNRKESTNRHGY